jgi:hypothetical protein
VLSHAFHQNSLEAPLVFRRIAERKDLRGNCGAWKMARSNYFRLGGQTKTFLGLELARGISKETAADWD